MILKFVVYFFVLAIHLFISRLTTCFSIRTDGTPLSRPDSSMYALQDIPGELPPSKASIPLIQIEGEPLMLRLTASS